MLFDDLRSVLFSPVVKWLSLLTLNQPSQVRTLAGEHIFVLCFIGIDTTTFWNYNISKHLPDNRNPPSFVSCLIGIDTNTFWNYNISKHLPDHMNLPIAIDVTKQASNHHIEVCLSYQEEKCTSDIQYTVCTLQLDWP